MSNRRPLAADMVASSSAEIVDNPLNPQPAAACSEGMESILQLIDGLRAIPIEDMEPAIVLRRERGRCDD